jgi:hypothetical protein
MTEQYDHFSDDLDNLTDEDFEAIGNILEGGIRRMHGEDILAAIDGQGERQEEQARSIFETLARLRLEQKGEGEDEQE